MKKCMVLIAILASSLLACSGATSDDSSDGPDDSNQSCSGAKCDATSLPELVPLDNEFGRCDVEPGDGTFELVCQMIPLHEAAPIRIEGGSAWVEFADGERTEAVWFEEEELNGTEKVVAQWDESAAYPITVRVLPVSMFRDRDSGAVDNPVDNWKPISPEITVTIDDAPEEATEFLLETNVRFWPVILWPTTKFADNWNDASLVEVDTIEKFNVDLTGSFEGTFGEIEYQYGRFANRGTDIDPLVQHIFFVPVGRDSKPMIDVTFNRDYEAGSVEVAGPGYYLIDDDGAVTRATPEEVLERGMSRGASDDLQGDDFTWTADPEKSAAE